MLRALSRAMTVRTGNRDLVRRVWRGAFWAPLALAVACGGITQTDLAYRGAAGSGAAAGAAGRSSGSPGAGPVAGVGSATGGSGGSAGGGASGGSGGSAGGGACTSSSQCPRGEACGYGLGCNTQGRCTSYGPLCNSYAPACACDGTNVDLCDGPPRKPLAHYGACESVDAGAVFACGSASCDPATQYCQVDEPGMPGPTSYSCQPIPAACAQQHTCSCIEMMTAGQCLGCASTCSDSGGGVTLTYGHP